MNSLMYKSTLILSPPPPICVQYNTRKLQEYIRLVVSYNDDLAIALDSTVYWPLHMYMYYTTNLNILRICVL